MAIKSNADIGRALLGTWSKYVPFDPSPKQLAFSMLPHREALGGGAAGGGKSALMLMDALKYTHIPNYSAIIFRRSLTDLKRSGGLLDLAFQWLGPYVGEEIKYLPSIHMFQWYNGASLTFGYVGSATAWEHYQGGSYQYIGWDELTQHSDIDYGEMFSRLRRNACTIHGSNYNHSCNLCAMYSELQKVPLRVRGTTNPGGRGHFWVKKRFKLYKNYNENLINPVTKKPGVWLSGDAERPFMPFFFTDNPGLDHVEYEKSLNDIPDENRKNQLKMGDWDVVANGIFKTEWFEKRWRYVGGYYAVVTQDGVKTHSYHENQLRIYTIVDVACSVREGVGERSFKQSQGSELPASWTAICTFGITPKNELLVLDMVRFQKEAPEIFDALKSTCVKWKPLFVAMETNGPGKPIAQMAIQMGIPLKEVITYMDKPSNSVEAQIRCKSGRVYLPENSLWNDDFIGEIACWTGHPHEVNDQVDVLSNGVHEFTNLAGCMDREGLHLNHLHDLPKVAKLNGRTLDFPGHGFW